MSLPIPKLDDRSFNDIVEEAKNLITKHCPQWTDFNPSDPGITMIELMAWMTEMVTYRLNRVPEKNYIEFLNLMGVGLKVPQSSRAWVLFTIANGAEKGKLPVIETSTKISTGDSIGKPVVFETVGLLNLTGSKIKKICSKFKDRINDHTVHLEKEQTKGFQIFLGEESVPHILYVGDDKFEDIGKESVIKIYATISSEPGSNLNIEWECWTGNDWETIVPFLDGTDEFDKSGEIIFDNIPKLANKLIEDISSFWIRASLKGMDSDKLPTFESLKISSALKADYWLRPDKCYLNTDENPFEYIDTLRDFYPFGKEPTGSDVFLFCSKAFSMKEAKISITITMSEIYSPLDDEELKELEVSWEYLSELGMWKLFGKSGATGVIKSEHNFYDQTDAFTKTGKVNFICPKDVELSLIQGEESYWIRIRISKGSYGKDKANIPVFRSLLINFDENPKNFEHYLSYNYYAYENLSTFIKQEKAIKPYKLLDEHNPAFYIAFDSQLSNKLHRIYFRLGEVDLKYSSKLSWEYFSVDSWKELRLVKDGTNGFSQNGAVEFIAPSEWSKTVLLGEDGYWLRSRWEVGSYDLPPCIKGVHLNAIEVTQATSITNTILGSSNGHAYQTCSFKDNPILPEPEILVKEVENPTSDEIEMYKELLGEKVIEETNPETGKVTGIWTRWCEVENFFKSGSESRHYTLDIYKAVITFGNGKMGKIPPVGRDNIKCAVYYIGGGARGNVGSNTITNLEKSYPYIDSVNNPDPASGGADAESVEEAKLRGPWVLKHRYRAVTIEDFEKLALEASGEVAKSKCFVKDGDINLIVVPKGDRDKLRLGNMLFQKIKNYIDARRLITTRFILKGPGYEDISISAEVTLTPQKIELIHEMKIAMETNLKNYFHPLKGGPTGNGWPMGRNVYISEIYNVLECIDGVDFVRKLKLNGKPWLRKVDIAKINYPYLKDVEIKVS